MGKLPPEPLTGTEMMRLIEACGAGVCGKRDRAMLATMWRTGLRISEVLALEIRDIDRSSDGWTIRVRHGKNDKHRTVAAGPDLAAFVQVWLDARAPHTSSKYVFCTMKTSQSPRGSKMATSTVRKNLAVLADRAGIQKRVHPHGIRHTFALELDSEGHALRVIQQSLGHSNARTTSTYLSGLGSREVIGALQMRRMPT